MCAPARRTARRDSRLGRAARISRVARRPFSTERLAEHGSKPLSSYFGSKKAYRRPSFYRGMRENGDVRLHLARDLERCHLNGAPATSREPPSPCSSEDTHTNGARLARRRRGGGVGRRATKKSRAAPGPDREFGLSSCTSRTLFLRPRSRQKPDLRIPRSAVLS